MRITCTNCGAQYEVPDEVIPESGRDVQCSNCGDTWFQTHPNNPDATPPVFDGDDSADQDWEEEPEETLPGDARPEAPEPEPQEPDPAPPRRGLDPEIANVLREEADREKAARAAEIRGGLETQPDLGLDDADDSRRRSQQAKTRMARLRGVTEQADETLESLDELTGNRRNLLPDIGEVDDALADAEQAEATARDNRAVAAQPRKGGFGKGLKWAIVLAVIATALYIMAPQFANMVPALADPLNAYVGWVDQLRAVLNERTEGLTAQIRTIIGG